jgi:hypothetical protein
MSLDDFQRALGNRSSISGTKMGMTWWGRSLARGRMLEEYGITGLSGQRYAINVVWQLFGESFLSWTDVAAAV